MLEQSFHTPERIKQKARANIRFNRDAQIVPNMEKTRRLALDALFKSPSYTALDDELLQRRVKNAIVNNASLQTIAGMDRWQIDTAIENFVKFKIAEAKELREKSDATVYEKPAKRAQAMAATKQFAEDYVDQQRESIRRRIQNMGVDEAPTVILDKSPQPNTPDVAPKKGGFWKKLFGNA